MILKISSCLVVVEMNSNIKRPKRIDQENEDDLLAFQEEFLRSKSQEQPAAKVVRMNPAEPAAATVKASKEPSKFDCESALHIFISSRLETD